MKAIPKFKNGQYVQISPKNSAKLENLFTIVTNLYLACKHDA